MHEIHFQVHSSVRKRWIDGDALIRSRMEEVAELAVRGRSAIESHDHLLLAKLMNRNFELRRQHISFVTYLLFQSITIFPYCFVEGDSFCQIVNIRKLLKIMLILYQQLKKHVLGLVLIAHQAHNQMKLKINQTIKKNQQLLASQSA